jgi:hypothetical protein
VAARVVVHSAKEVWAELRGFTGLDEIWGPGTEPWPNDSLMFAVAASRALRVYAVDDACCRFCGRPHADPPGDLCPAAREDYDGLERWGDDLGLTTSDAV